MYKKIITLLLAIFLVSCVGPLRKNESKPTLEIFGARAIQNGGTGIIFQWRFPGVFGQEVDGKVDFYKNGVPTSTWTFKRETSYGDFKPPINLTEGNWEMRAKFSCGYKKTNEAKYRFTVVEKPQLMVGGEQYLAKGDTTLWIWWDFQGIAVNDDVHVYVYFINIETGEELKGGPWVFVKKGAKRSIRPPINLMPGQYRMKVQVSSGALISDWAPHNFTVVGKPFLTLTCRPQFTHGEKGVTASWTFPGLALKDSVDLAITYYDQTGKLKGLWRSTEPSTGTWNRPVHLTEAGEYIVEFELWKGPFRTGEVRKRFTLRSQLEGLNWQTGMKLGGYTFDQVRDGENTSVFEMKGPSGVTIAVILVKPKKFICEGLCTDSLHVGFYTGSDKKSFGMSRYGYTENQIRNIFVNKGWAVKQLEVVQPARDRLTAYLRSLGLDLQAFEDPDADWSFVIKNYEKRSGFSTSGYLFRIDMETKSQFSFSANDIGIVRILVEKDGQLIGFQLRWFGDLFGGLFEDPEGTIYKTEDALKRAIKTHVKN